MLLILFIYAILLYLYIHTFYYLKKAEKTGCFTPKVNLKYMQFFQLLEIVALTITVLFFPYFLKMKKGKRVSLFEPLLMSVKLAVYTIISPLISPDNDTEALVV
jgi:hypothetical protein